MLLSNKLFSSLLKKILGFGAIVLLLLVAGVKINNTVAHNKRQKCIEQNSQNRDNLPFALDDALLWLKASEGVKLDEKGRVVKWQDLSCNNHHATQSISELRPKLVDIGAFGNPAIKFEGGQNLEGKIGKFYAPVTIFTTVKYAEHDEPQYILSIGDGSVRNANLGNGNHISLSRENGSYYAMWGYPKELEPGHLRVADSLPALTNFNITVRYRKVDESLNHLLWINGKEYQPKGEDTATLKQEKGQYYLPEKQIFQNQGDYAIGRWLHERHPWYLHAEIDEILILNREYSDEKRSAIEQFLNTK